MNDLLQQPATSRPLGLLGLALAGLMLMGFHEVVSGSVHQAAMQRAEVLRLQHAAQTCRAELDAARRQLCISRLQVRAGLDTIDDAL